MNLAEFLLARIAEDEKPCVCLDGRHGACGGGWCSEDCRVCSGGDAYTRDERVLAECEAKRRIIRAVKRNPNAPWDAYAIGRDDVGREVLRLLALPYADHPDYRPEWRP